MSFKAQYFLVNLIIIIPIVNLRVNEGTIIIPGEFINNLPLCVISNLINIYSRRVSD